MGFWSGRRVCVTGGAGFIGSHLVEFLIADGAIVTVADNLERGKLSNLDAVRDVIQFLELDLRTQEGSETACRGQEVVFNLAAKVAGIHYNQFHMCDMFENNMLLQQMPIAAAAREGVMRFCQVSHGLRLSGMYARVPTPETEGDRGEPEPTNAGYGWAKRMGERLARWYAKENSDASLHCSPFQCVRPAGLL